MALRRAVLLALPLLVAGCNGNTGRGICGCDTATEQCIAGRCFPLGQQAPQVPEPEATPASCPAFTQVAAATPIPNVAPAAGCPASVQPSPTPDLTQELGPNRVGTTVTFQVPANAASFTIVLQAESVPTATIPLRAANGSTTSIDNTAVPRILHAPDGSVWYDDMVLSGADPSQDLVFFASDSPGVGSLSVPNTSKSLQVTSAGGLPAGTWSMVVGDYAFECKTEASLATQCGAGVVPAAAFAGYDQGTYRTAVLVKPARTAQGALNVGLYLHRCPGATYDTTGNCVEPALTAAGALTDADAQRFVATMASLVAKGGLCLGQVTWYDLPQWAQDKWKAGLDLDQTADCAASLSSLLALSQPVAGGQMNLFLVPEILAKPDPSSPKTQIVGIDGTIPGPGTFPGTVQSGAAVSAANLRDGRSACTGALSLGCGADVTAYIATHEAGHYLGLYHVTESNGAAYDPLDDTPKCDCQSCASASLAGQCGTASAQVTGTDCAKGTATCSGGRNLMFWLLDSVSQGKVSPEQSEVMRASPLVR